MKTLMFPALQRTLSSFINKSNSNKASGVSPKCSEIRFKNPNQPNSQKEAAN